MNLLEETLVLKLIYLIMEQKQNLKKATGIDTSKLTAKSDIASLKVEIDKLDIDKLVPVPVGFKSAKWSDVVKKLSMIN